MENPILNVTKLTKPITKLIDVVSAGIGEVYAPIGVVRQAKADAKAKIIQAKADCEVATIRQRAQVRINYRETLRQENIEKIVSQATLELPKSVSKAPVDKDWIFQFFDHAQDVCDSDMQILWSKILAGEVSSPGSYAKRTLQFLKTMDKADAEVFSKYCSFTFSFEDGWSVVFDDEVTKRHFIAIAGNYAFVQHFNAIGLINNESIVNPSNVDGIVMNFFGQMLKLSVIEKRQENQRLTKLELPFSLHVFTQTGQELSKIAGAKPIKGYLDEVRTYFESENKVAIKRITRRQ